MHKTSIILGWNLVQDLGLFVQMCKLFESSDASRSRAPRFGLAILAFLRRDSRVLCIRLLHNSCVLPILTCLCIKSKWAGRGRQPLIEKQILLWQISCVLACTSPNALMQRGCGQTGESGNRHTLSHRDGFRQIVASKRDARNLAGTET